MLWGFSDSEEAEILSHTTLVSTQFLQDVAKPIMNAQSTNHWFVHVSQPHPVSATYFTNHPTLLHVSSNPTKCWATHTMHFCPCLCSWRRFRRVRHKYLTFTSKTLRLHATVRRNPTPPPTVFCMKAELIWFVPNATLCGRNTNTQKKSC